MEENENGITESVESNSEPMENDTEIHISENIVTTEDRQIPVVNSGTKQSDIKKFIVIMCILCALGGGIIGGVIAGTVVGRKSNSNSNSDISYVQENATHAEVQTLASATTAVSPEKETGTVLSGTSSSLAEKPNSDSVLSAKMIYANNVASVVSIDAKSSRFESMGTGFIISEKGYIVTNYHVVEGASSYTVTMYDDSQYSATLVGYEDSNDIAILKISPKNTIYSLVYGKSSDLSVGDDVYIIGNPLGDLTFTLTKGVVSALNRLIEGEDGMAINMFQTDAAVNSGNSGGPVFNSHGYVVGIASAKYASSSIEGLSFCIPIDDVRSMIDEIINNGYVSEKPLMGISVYDTVTANYGFIQSTKSINGAKVAAVGTDLFTVNSGIKVDDVIVAADGVTINSVSSLRTVLSAHRSGDTIKLTVYRNGVNVDLSITLGEYKPSSSRTQYANVYDL